MLSEQWDDADALLHDFAAMMRPVNGVNMTFILRLGVAVMILGSGFMFFAIGGVPSFSLMGAPLFLFAIFLPPLVLCFVLLLLAWVVAGLAYR